MYCSILYSYRLACILLSIAVCVCILKQIQFTISNINTVTVNDMSLINFHAIARNGPL